MTSYMFLTSFFFLSHCLCEVSVLVLVTYQSTKKKERKKEKYITYMYTVVQSSYHQINIYYELTLRSIINIPIQGPNRQVSIVFVEYKKYELTDNFFIKIILFQY